MRLGLLSPCAWLLGGILAAGAAGATAATYTCKDPAGRTTLQQTPCPVVNAPPPPPPPKPPCELDADKLKATVRMERQFLTRFPDEATHRGAQVADLQPVVERIRRAHARYEELRVQRGPADKEAAFYVGKPMPAWLRSQLDANEAQFAALVDILRGAEQDIGEIQARYQCQRATFGKLWTGGAPGSSACNRPACAPP